MSYVLLYDHPVYGCMVVPADEFAKYFTVTEGQAYSNPKVWEAEESCYHNLDKWLISYTVGEARGWKAGEYPKALRIVAMYLYQE